MELWIRSQDKESLTKVSNVQYTYKKGDLYTDVSGKHYIGTYYDNLKILGTYKTKERVLEVLDEIQSILSGKCILKSYDNVTPEFGENLIIKPCEVHIEQLNTYVYEMPKE